MTSFVLHSCHTSIMSGSFFSHFKQANFNCRKIIVQTVKQFSDYLSRLLGSWCHFSAIMMTLQLSVLQLHLDDKRSLIILGLSHLGLHMIRKQRSFGNDSWSVSPISIIQGYTISWWPYFKNFNSNYFLFLLIVLFVSVIVDVGFMAWWSFILCWKT